MEEEIEKLRKAIVKERVAHLTTYNKAYPDVGMSPSQESLIIESIESLVKEGILPANWILTK